MRNSKNSRLLLLLHFRNKKMRLIDSRGNEISLLLLNSRNRKMKTKEEELEK